MQNEFACFQCFISACLQMIHYNHLVFAVIPECKQPHKQSKFGAFPLKANFFADVSFARILSFPLDFLASSST